MYSIIGIHLCFGDLLKFLSRQLHGRLFQVVSNFYGSSNTYEKIQDVLWPAGRTEPPLDAPFCGFDNENPACIAEGT